MTQSETYTERKFKALVTDETDDGQFVIRIKDRSIHDLPAHEVLIRVLYSGLNYKDALSASGHKGITKKYPHTPGIDAAGVVANSADPSLIEGEEVIVTGYDLGMNTSGGFAEYISVPAAWVVKRPQQLSLEECMIIGTSGFTAASGIYEFMKHGVDPDAGEVLVTGATGAVGSMAVAMMAAAGYSVCAATGKASSIEWLKELGASSVIDRKLMEDTTGKPLLPARWIAVFDTVGGNILSTAIRSTRERGIITNCGMIASNDLNVSVLPFILRAVRLVGIASAETPMERRLEIWDLIQSTLKPACLHSIARAVSIAEVPREIELMLRGDQQGKVIIKMD